MPDRDPVKPQREIISWLFDDPRQLWNDIETGQTDIADPERGVPIIKVFHELQVVTAAKIALLEVPPTRPDGLSSLQRFGEALLMVTDLVDLHTQSHELTESILGDSDLDRWITFVVPNRLFHGGGNLRHALARSYDLYLTDRTHLRSKTGYVNLPDLFEQVTGVPPDLAWVAMLRVLGNTTTDRPQAPLTVDTFGEELNLSSDEERAVFALFAARADTLRQKLMRSGCGADDLRVFDPLPFGETPVVVHEGKVFCPSVAFLHRKRTRGWFHIFLTGLDEDERGRFLAYMGPVFEDYIDMLLRRVFPKESARYIGPDVLDSPALSVSKKCDAVIVYERSVVLIEVKATLLHLPVWRDGDIRALAKKIDDIIGDSAEQFGGAIRLIEQGHLKEQGVDPSQIESYLPLVVTLETMPNDFMVYRLVERRTRRRAMLEDRKARPVQWAGVGDIESLETLLGAGHSLHDILMARLKDRSYREESLGNWLIGRYEPAALGPNPYLERRLDEITARALEEFLSHRRAD